MTVLLNVVTIDWHILEKKGGGAVLQIIATQLHMVQNDENQST